MNPYFTQYTEVILRWIIDFTVKDKTIKLLEEGIGGYLHDLGVSKDFLNWTESIIIKEK